MMDANPLDEAKDAVLRFARAWTEWEILMARDKESIHDPAMKEAHARLIQDHCTPKKRAYVDGQLTYCRPPTYGSVVEQNLIHMELGSPTKTFIDFNTPFQHYRFVVVKKGGIWKVDSIKWKVIPTDDWKNGLIGM
ncbi:MAG: NTF2 fold immunity protein [Verrucomicrobiota bacterium]